jgi:thiol-disulfide isomerase/thioredoxin
MRPRLTLALILPIALASAAFAAPPTDQQIDAFINSVEKAWAPEGASPAEKREAKRDAAEQGLKNLDLKEATLAQLDKIVASHIALITPELGAAIDSRLVELAKAQDADGARAADLRLSVIPLPDKPTRESIGERIDRTADLADEVLKHPGAKDLCASGGGDNLLRAVATIAGSPNGERLMKDHKFFEAITPFISDKLSPSLMVSLARLSSPLVESRESLGQEKYDALRTRLASASDAAAASLAKEHAAKAAEPKPAAPDPDDEAAVKKAQAAERALALEERQISYLKDNATLLRGPYATGTLIDHAAPAITFDWVSGDKKIHDFSDLKGRVVMVDFWATWCGPCKAAFPGIRELQSRYAGYPVTILGVTSIQGKRNVNKAGKPTHTEDNPAAERDLMRQFMKDMDMTWTVAYSAQSCFNPDFGVRGIPHIAIIDASGKVRFNGLRPHPAEEAEHIDALLKEAKLPYPESPYTPPKKADKDNDED